MDLGISGRVALVTGAGRGIGAEIGRTLAAEGVRVAVNDLFEERAEESAKGLRSAGAEAIGVAFDVTDYAAVEAGVRHVLEAFGQVDILVNNAGIPADMAPIRFRDLPPARWRSYIDINLYGSLHCIAAVIEPMVDAHWGRIIQISSGAGRTGLKIGVSLYGASKSGIEGFIRHLSTEVASTGVTANALALGLMAAPNKQQDATVTAGIARSIPVGRLGTPDDVGAAVVFLASNEMEWMTGQTVNLNGGSTFS
jgi:NAD(P)-dependent dehydrogenase (short-subunit alcohol dehydrogenase family)